jgi:hypothetical protein
VLYVGNQTAERINHAQSGKLVVLVPGDLDLAQAPIFLGTIGLPEEVLANKIEVELAAALAAGAVPPNAATLAKAIIAEPLNLANYDELRLHAIDLVEQHSPEEQDLINGARGKASR